MENKKNNKSKSKPKLSIISRGVETEDFEEIQEEDSSSDLEIDQNTSSIGQSRDARRSTVNPKSIGTGMKVNYLGIQKSRADIISYRSKMTG